MRRRGRSTTKDVSWPTCSSRRVPVDYVAEMMSLPALSVIGSPTKRSALIELATEAEARGFSGLACSGNSGMLAMCLSLAHATSTIPICTSIQPIYLSHPSEIAATAAHITEISSGRFRLGLGVSHAAVLSRLGVSNGKPLSDMRNVVAAIRSTDRVGTLSPIVLACLRNRMLDLAVEIADGAVWANVSLSHMPTQVARVPENRRPSFELTNMVPTVIDNDVRAARAIHRRTLSVYITLPNYRNYWKMAGYEQEMTDIETALAARDRQASVAAMSDRWVDDCTISGSASQVRERIAAWFATGVTPVAVMSSTSGGQAKAIRELFDAYAP